MLIFDTLELVYLAAPKTGSTSFEMAFKGYANAHSSGSLPKHARYGKFCKAFPEIAERYETVTCLRDPLETLHSWYRYRARVSLRGSQNSTHGMSFEEFFAEWCSKRPAPYADINASVNFVLDRRGAQFENLKVIRYEDIDLLFQHVAGRLGVEPDFQRRNISPDPGKGLLHRLRQLLGWFEPPHDESEEHPSLSEVRPRLNLDHPKIVEAYDRYERVQFTEVEDLRDSPLRALR